MDSLNPMVTEIFICVLNWSQNNTHESEKGAGSETEVDGCGRENQTVVVEGVTRMC